MIVDPKKTPQSSEKNKYDVTVKVSVRDNEGKKSAVRLPTALIVELTCLHGSLKAINSR